MNRCVGVTECTPARSVCCEVVGKLSEVVTQGSVVVAVEAA